MLEFCCSRDVDFPGVLLDLLFQGRVVILDFLVGRLVLLKLFVLDVDDLQLLFSQSLADLILLLHFGELGLELLHLLHRLPVLDALVDLLLEDLDFRAEAVEGHPVVSVCLLLHFSARLRSAQAGSFIVFIACLIEADFPHRMGQLELFLLVAFRNFLFFR